MKTGNLIANIIATSLLIVLFLLSFTWIIFDFNSSVTSLKDSLGITSSLFGGVATLVAAYIASKLFNDWKELHNQQIYSDLALNLKSKSDTLENSIIAMQFEIDQIQYLIKSKSINQLEATSQLKNKKSEVMINFKNLSSAAYDLFFIFKDKINLKMIDEFDTEFEKILTKKPKIENLNDYLIYLNEFLSKLSNAHDSFYTEILKVLEKIKVH